MRINTSQAERTLNNLQKKIKSINQTLNAKVGKTGLDTQISKARVQEEKLRQSILKTKAAELKVTEQKHKTALAAQKVKDATDKANHSTNNLLSTVRRLAGAYLGIQTVKLGITASDTVTSAQNRLNNLEGGNPEKTAESMDKIYAASQRARTGYDTMLHSVSKTMTLAPDAFQGNIDNAIRFQEIMAKSYTVGGASAQEMSTSMYQLTQALASGVLAGDELRSVREGAPIAYKEIEKFAQGVYNTTDSLKDMASEGKITSDMVVAAIMNAGDKIEKKFENTEMTFAQAWTRIKNTAMKAFQPALESLNKMLNSDAGRSMVEGISKGLVAVGKALSWVIDKFSKFFKWCAKNWGWLKFVILGVILVVIAIFAQWAAVAIWTALCNIASFVAQYWGLLLIVAGLMAILYIYELWIQGTISTTEAIVYCLLVIAAMALVAAIVLGSMWLFWIAIALVVIALIMAYFSELCGYINVGIQFVVNVWLWLCNVVIGAWNWCVALVKNVLAGIGNFFVAVFNWISAIGWNTFAAIANFAMALKEAIGAVASNIGIAFQNAWIWAKNTFWEFLASVIDGVSKLEPVINGIAELLGGEGVDFSALSADIRGKKEDYLEFVDVGAAWESGMNTFEYKDAGAEWDKGMNTFEYSDLGDAWNSGFNTNDAFSEGWMDNAYNDGFAWGQGIEYKVNAWGSQFQDPNNSLVNQLGLNGSLPDPNDPNYAIDGAYDPSKMMDTLGGIKDDTGDISDSMNLKDEDLEYLRKIAEMEWRNEFTTAEIKVDMTNHNQVNGDRDLDGIVEYLSDVLREEMTSVAYGVHY